MKRNKVKDKKRKFLEFENAFKLISKVLINFFSESATKELLAHLKLVR